MSTNLRLLPYITFTAETDSNGDWLDQILFTNNGAPLDLTGIAFTISLRPSANPSTRVRPLTVSTVSGTLVNNGLSGVLALNVPAAQMAQLPAGSYAADILAVADGISRNLSEVGFSTITHNQGIS